MTATEKITAGVLAAGTALFIIREVKARANSIGTIATERQLEFDFGNGYQDGYADMYGERAARQVQNYYAARDFDDFMRYLDANYEDYEDLKPWEKSRLRMFMRMFPEVAKREYGLQILPIKR